MSLSEIQPQTKQSFRELREQCGLTDPVLCFTTGIGRIRLAEIDGGAKTTATEELAIIFAMLAAWDRCPLEYRQSVAPQDLPKAQVAQALSTLFGDVDEERADAAWEGALSALRRALQPPATLSELPEFMTVEQVADFLGESRQTIYTAVRTRQIPSVRFAGRQIRIPRSHFERVALQCNEAVDEVRS